MKKKPSASKPNFIDYKKIPHISIRELAFKLKQVDDVLDNAETPESKKDRKPRFAFFLGAGASFQSGIKLAGQMMNDFKRRIFDRECPDLENDDEKEGWLKKQSWFLEGEKEYACLFERYDDDKLARQKYIEAVIKKGNPSFGYLMLAYLLANNYANTILTTNFDDLAYTSCVTFTGIRPLIYAYGTLASEMRLASLRPKIFKLHGDFLYSALINTDNEMEEMLSEFQLPEQYPKIAQKIKDISMLDFNMGDDVVRILSEYGLIVVGYEGNDESIRNIFRNIPYNRELFWCYWKPKPPNQEVLKLLQEKNGKLIAIEGFDEFMAEIGNVIKLKEDKLIADIEAQKDAILQLIAKFKPEYTKDFVNDVVEKVKDEKEKPQIDFTALLYKGIDAENKFEFEKAIKIYNRALKIINKTDGEKHPEYTTFLSKLAGVYKSLGNYDKAVELYEKTLSINEKNDNKSESDLAKDLNNLGYAYRLLGNYFKAEETHLKALKICISNFAENHFETAKSYNNLGAVYDSQDDYQKAEGYYQKALQIRLNIFGENHPDTAGSYNNLGNIYYLQNNYTKAEENHQKALHIWLNVFGEKHPYTATSYNNLGLVYDLQNDYQKAEENYQKALQIRLNIFGENHPDTALMYNNLGVIYENQDKLLEAKEYYEKSCEIKRKFLPENHPEIKRTTINLKRVRKKMGR